MQADETLRAGLVAAGLPELADRLELGPVPYRFAGHRSLEERRLEEGLTYPWRRLPICATQTVHRRRGSREKCHQGHYSGVTRGRRA